MTTELVFDPRRETRGMRVTIDACEHRLVDVRTGHVYSIRPDGIGTDGVGLSYVVWIGVLDEDTLGQLCDVIDAAPKVRT